MNLELLLTAFALGFLAGLTLVLLAWNLHLKRLASEAVQSLPARAVVMNPEGLQRLILSR